MPTKHTVREGECTSSIAFHYGFFADTVWNDPGNASLRSKREDMNILAPGDELTIPDKRLREETRQTGSSYRFQRRGVPAKLKLQILDAGKPVTDTFYAITIDGRQTSGQTNESGEIQVSISPAARKAHLIVGIGEQRREYELKLGFLQPVDHIEGVQARLANLGFNCGDELGAIGPMTADAIRAFQAKMSLPVTGDPDDATRSKLKEVHDQESN